MGLFDKFRKKVRDAASEVDEESLSAEDGSEEAIQAMNQHQPIVQNTPEDDWEELDETEELELPATKEDDWDDWDDEDNYTLPTKLSRKEK